MTNNIQTVQLCYADFGSGNIQGVLDLLHDDVIWVDPGYPEIPYAGKCRGKEEVMNFFAGLGRTIEFSTFEPRLFLSDGNYVAVTGFFTGKSFETGKTCQSEWMMLWEVIDGKIKSYQAYIDTYNVAAALN